MGAVSALGRVARSACLFLWVAIFLGWTIYPQARSLYRGLTGVEQAWDARFREHERLRRFLVLTSSPGNTANRPVLYVYGGGPELGKALDFMQATKYLLYPDRMYASAAGEATSISSVAVFDAVQGTLDTHRFCRRIEGRSYSCRIHPAEKPGQEYDVQAKYTASELTLAVRAREFRQPDPAFLIFSLQTANRTEIPLNILLRRDEAGDGPDPGPRSYRMDFQRPGRPPRPTFPFRVLAVDNMGRLSASKEYRLVFTQ